jgi:DNA-binding MarR family transcriptional regulator
VQAELTLAGTSALARLESARSATSSDLARAEQITLQAMGATLAAIEERGLVERRPDPSDGRRVTMSLTTAGQQALWNKRIAPIEQLANALAGGFTQAEVETMRTAAPLIKRLGESL